MQAKKMSSKHLLSVILPVYNEGANIKSVLSELEPTIKHPHETLIVYDFNEDDTVPEVKKLQSKFRHVKLVKNNLGRGVVKAFQAGLAKSRGDLIVVMPADLADDPKVVNQMVDKTDQGFDLVAATRYSGGGERHGGQLLNRTLSRLAGLSTPFLLGIPTHDLTNGFKMYRKSLLNKISIDSTQGWVYAMELTLKAHHAGYKISEIPSIWRNRTQGRSKFKLWKWLPKYLHWYLWGLQRRFKIF